MKVLYLAGGYPSSDNPAHGVFNKRAAQQLSKVVDLTLVHYRFYKPGRKMVETIQEDGFLRVVLSVPFIPFFQSRLYFLNNFIFKSCTRYFLANYLKETDVVHASDGNLGVFSAMLKNRFGYKLVVQFIGGDLNQDLPPHRHRSFFKGWKEHVDYFTFNSGSLLQRFNELFGSTKHTKVIYRGVDLQKFSKKETYDLSRPLHFYFLGGLPNYQTFSHGRNTKGGLTLMKAWQLIDKKYADKSILLKFAGPDSDIALVHEWRSNLNGKDKVEIIGKIPAEEIPGFHKANDVIIVPSLEEGLPNTAMEALASGNTVIATKVGGIPEVITHQQNGLLIESDDVDELVDALSKIIENRPSLINFGNKAREEVEVKFNSKNFAVNYGNVYNKILE